MCNLMLLTTQDKSKIYATIKKDPNLGLLQAVSLIAERAQQEINVFLESAAKNMPEMAMTKHIQSLKGADGIDGINGHTPTDAELTAIILPLIPKPKEGKTPTAKELLALIKPLIPVVKDGETPSDARLIKLIRGLMPVLRQPEDGKPGKDGSPDKPEEIANKLNTTSESINQGVIKGLPASFKRLEKAIREKHGGGGGKGGGGMGNIQHESKAVSSASTSVTTSYNIAGKGFAIWAYYQGQMIVRGTHYSVNGKTLTLLFTPQDSTAIDLIYMRT